MVRPQAQVQAQTRQPIMISAVRHGERPGKADSESRRGMLVGPDGKPLGEAGNLLKGGVEAVETMLVLMIERDLTAQEALDDTRAVMSAHGWGTVAKANVVWDYGQK